jgi:antitoxin ParD1/3/4
MAIAPFRKCSFCGRQVYDKCMDQRLGRRGVGVARGECPFRGSHFRLLLLRRLAMVVAIIPTGEASMSQVEKISIALPPEMAADIRKAVETGEYASSSEVVRDALRDWKHKRSLQQQGVAELRAMWQEALSNADQSAAAADGVLERLERKYQAIVQATSDPR